MLYQTVYLPPTVTMSTANLPDNATLIVIDGTNFSPNVALDSVAFSDANGDIITGTVIAATSTSLTVLPITGLGGVTPIPTALDAIVTVGPFNSGAPVQVATVGPFQTPPTVTAGAANLADSSMSLTIDGTNFDATTPGQNVVFFNLGVAGTVTAATTTQLTVTLTVPPTSLGGLTAESLHRWS